MRDGWAAAALAATAARIAAIPAILALLAVPTRPAQTAAAAVFAGAALTDALDGVLARRGTALTPQGAVLDLTADKLLVCVVLIDMAARRLAPARVVQVIVARELIVCGMRAYAGASGVSLDVRPAGKLKMVVTGLAIPAAMLRLPGAASLLALAAGLTVASAWPYLAITIGTIRGTMKGALKGSPGAPGHPPGL